MYVPIYMYVHICVYLYIYIHIYVGAYISSEGLEDQSEILGDNFGTKNVGTKKIGINMEMPPARPVKLGGSRGFGRRVFQGSQAPPAAPKDCLIMD